MSCFVTSDDISVLSSPYSRSLMEETGRCLKVKFANVLLFALFQIIPFSILSLKMQAVH